MIRGLVYLTGLVTLALVACVAAVAHKVHEWPWGEYVREGSERLAEKLDPRSREASPAGGGTSPAGREAHSPAPPRRSDRQDRRREDADGTDARDGRWAGASRHLRHTVRRGDTLYALSRRYYDDPLLWRRIARANEIRKPSDMRAGRVIVIPPGLVGPGGVERGARGRDADRLYDLKLAMTPALEAAEACPEEDEK